MEPGGWNCVRARFGVTLLLEIDSSEITFLTGEESGEMLYVFVAERAGETEHDRVLALARLVIPERFGKVIGVLAGESRKLRIRGP